MTQVVSGTKPDVDFTDGNFYADGGAREAYRWMRANQPVFRDRNGLAAAASYQSVLDAERNPELFSNTGGIRPDTPGLPYMIDMDDPAHVLRRKLVNSGFTRKRVMDKVPSIATLCDTLIDSVCERGECDFVRDIAAPLPMAVIGDMLGVLPEERGMLLKWSDDLVTGPQLAHRRGDRPGDDGRLRDLYDVHHGHHRQAARRAHRGPVLDPGQRRGRRAADVRRRNRHGDTADSHRR